MQKTAKRILALLMAFLVGFAFIPALDMGGQAYADGSTWSVNIETNGSDGLYGNYDVNTEHLNLNQTVNQGSNIETIVFEAWDEFYFPSNYVENGGVVGDLNGLSISVSSDLSKLTISGRPEGNVNLSLKSIEWKSNSPHSAPTGLGFTATGYDTGTISGTTADMEYRGGSAAWKSCTAGSTSAVGLESGFPLKVRYKGSSTVKASEETKVVEELERGEYPGAYDEYDYDTQKYYIVGITNTMKWRKVGEAWQQGTAFTGTARTEVTPGDYEVRTLASGQKLESDPTEITVERQHAGYKIDFNLGANTTIHEDYDSSDLHQEDVTSTIYCFYVKAAAGKYFLASADKTENGITFEREYTGGENCLKVYGNPTSNNLTINLPGATGTMGTTAAPSSSNVYFVGDTSDDGYGEVAGATADMIYSKDGGATEETDWSYSEFRTVRFENPAASNSLWIKKIGNIEKNANGDELAKIAKDSDWLKLTVTRPSAPAVTAQNCQSADNTASGVINGITADMIYGEKNADENWDNTTYTHFTAAEIAAGKKADLTPGTYRVRYEGGTNKLASPPTDLVINGYSQVAKPTFNLPGGTYRGNQTVTISCETAGASIRYTTNGEEPSATSFEYTVPLTLESSTTLKAKAFKDGSADSLTETATYTILQGYTVTYAGGTGASGSMPDGIAYEGESFTLPECGFTMTDCEFDHWEIEGETDEYDPDDTYIFNASKTVTAVWTVNYPILPTSGAFDGSKEISITGITGENTKVYYTTNGSDPSVSTNTARVLYTAPFTINRTTTVKACAEISALGAVSGVEEVTYTKNPSANGKTATPLIHPDVESFKGSVEVIITCTTPNSTIYYTLDGTDPDPSISAQYDPATKITLTDTKEVNAIAVAAGYDESDQAWAYYYKLEEYDITYAGGEGATGGMDADKAYEDEEYILPACGFTKENYDFAGWSVSNDSVIRAAGTKMQFDEAKVITATWKLKTPTLPASGTFKGEKVIEITAPAGSGFVTYYTLDGTDPTTASDVYDPANSIKITGTTTVKAMAVLNGSVESEVVSATYTLSSGHKPGSGGNSGAGGSAEPTPAPAPTPTPTPTPAPGASVEVKATVTGDKAVASVAANDVKDIVAKGETTVVNSEIGRVEIPSDTLGEIVNRAGGDLNVSMETKSASEVLAAAGGADKLAAAGFSASDLNGADSVEVNMTAGGKNVTDFNGNSLRLLIPLTGNRAAGRAYMGVSISDNGTMENFTAKCVNVDGKLYGETNASHLTTFVVTGKEVKNPFTDVKSGDYFFQPVLWAVSKDVTGGVSETSFAPNAGCTRAQMVTFLWRAAGKPWASANRHFSDVAEGAYYKDAVEWAIAAGITNGVSETVFDPNGAVTREQLASFIYRYVQSKGQGFTGAWMFLLDYSDASKISSWADEAMHWCVMKEIVGGTGNKMLTPQGAATRGQIVTMLYRYFNL